MTIIDQLLLLGFLLACGYAVIVAQAIALRRILHSLAWTLLAAGFTVSGLRQLWGLIRLPAAILRAQAQGVMPEHLTTEQWVMIAGAFLAVVLLILGLDRLRRDLRKLGI